MKLKFDTKQNKEVLLLMIDKKERTVEQYINTTISNPYKDVDTQ